MIGWLIFGVVLLTIVGVVVWNFLDSSIVKIEPGDMGLLLVHGRATDKSLLPGLRWVPTLRRRMIEVYPSRELAFRAGSDEAPGSDDLERSGAAVPIVLGDRTTGAASFTIRFRLRPDELKLVHERFGRDGIWSAVRDLGSRSVRAALNEADVTIDDLFGPARKQLEERIGAAVRDDLAPHGFEVTAFQLVEIDLGRAGEAIQAAVRARLELEREQAESEMRVERARRDAEVAAVLAGVEADPALRYRESDAWRELAAELARNAAQIALRRERAAVVQAEVASERVEAEAEPTGGAEA